MADQINTSSNETAIANVVQFVPTEITKVQVESPQVKIVQFPYKNTMIKKTWNVGSDKVATTVSKSLLEMFKSEFVGLGTVWINSVTINMTSKVAKGVVAVAITAADETPGTIDEVYATANRKYVEFSAATKGADFSWTLDWPNSVGRQLKPYDPHYEAPHLSLVSDDANIRAVVWISIDHSKSVIDGGSF